MSATETITLEALPHNQSAPIPTAKTPPQPLDLPSFDPANPDTIIIASRLADAEVPDGGYGWVVIFACSTVMFWFVGTTYCWGIMQAALVSRKLSSPSTISFIGSLTCAWTSISALVNARVVRGIGARNSSLIGIGLLGLGEILSGFSTRNVGALFFTTGVVMGIGGSLLFNVICTVPAQYFNKKRGIANGVVSAGGGIGGAIIAFIVNALIQGVGPEWTFRVLGLVTLGTGLPAAWLIKERAPLTTTTFVEWSLFRNLKFSTLFLAGVLGMFPLPVVPFFLPLYSASLGLSPGVGAGLVAGFNFSSALSRVCCGFLADFIGPVNTLCLAMLVLAMSLFVLWPVSNSLTPLIVFVIINGTANGGFFSTMPTVVGTVFGSRRMGVAMGMIMTGWGGGYLMGAPIAGYLLAAYGGENSTLKAYHPAIFYAGSMALASALLVLVLKLSLNRNPFKRL